MIGTAMSNNGSNVQTLTFTGAAMPTYPSIFPTLPTGGTAAKPTIFAFSPNFQNPKVQQSSVGVDQQIGNDYSLGVTYQYVKGDDLQRSRDVNEGTPTTVTANINGGGTVDFVKYTTRPFTNFARVIAFESTASSKYNGVTLDFQRRLANNWQARIAWTHSMVKDNKPDATAVVPFSSGDDAKYVSQPLDINHDWAYGDADVRDRVVLSGVWTLNNYASGITNPVMHALASGWTISGIASYQTGQPYSAKVNSDLNGDQNSANDLAPGTLRNQFRYPSQFDVSPRITRDLPVFHGAAIQLIAEAFNVLNRSNVNGVNQTMFSYDSKTNTLTRLSTFGTPTSSSGPRIIQLAAKVTF